MSNSNHNRPLLTIITAAVLLAGVMLAFSNPTWNMWLTERGLRFTHTGQLIRGGEKPFTIVKPKKIVAKPDSVILKNLTAAERKRIDTLHRKIAFLNNPSINGKAPLDAFFASLETVSDSLVHIWYYGDSQIEGDRITQDLRLLLQKQFGGNGQGLVPFNDVASYRYIETECRGLTKYNVFNHRKTNGFGFSGIKYRIKSGDSITGESSIKVLSGLQFSKVYLLHDKDDKSMIRVMTNKKTETNVSLTGYKTLIYEGKCKELSIKFGSTSTTFYGYLLEGQRGIQIDNCGIRGHSGDGLLNISNATLQLQAALLNTKLVVFHYGNNAIPYITSEAHAAQVGNAFYKLFVKYRKALPNLSILVVSGGDMGRMIDEKPEPYPYAAALATEMEKAAEKAGCAFFDMHAMMQANEGIVGWVKQGKASIDGHLSAHGQKYFAQTLYRELMKSFEIYQLSHKISH